MTQAIAIPVVPDSAPFSPSQRAWLNGFIAGLLGSRKAEMPGAPAPAAVQEEESFPWHDAALKLDERLKLAEGKPFDRVLMAAMAQLDCGACGYLCKTYSEAIARGGEKDLSKCSPGGKETARKLKDLLAHRSSFAPATVEVTANGKNVAAPKAVGYDRDSPFPAQLLECKLLNGPGSAKDTRFVSLDLGGSGLTYSVGDALAVMPENCHRDVEAIMDAIGVHGNEPVQLPTGGNVTIPFREALLKHYAIAKPSDGMLQLMAEAATDPAQRQRLDEMRHGDGPPAGFEILDLFREFKPTRLTLKQFIGTLVPLRPRLYSIASSQRATPDEVHLTIGVVRYVNALGRPCKGVASTYLAERVRTGQRVSVFVHKAAHFGLPKDPKAPIIMVGPGTGIAPFRAFLLERRAIGAPGKNWLFFGDQRREHDFLYRQEMESLFRDGFLSRLDLAFSRDQDEKVYVQHRMMENAGEIWKWIDGEGAHFYVCGDAKRMASDVDAALKQIVADQGGMSAEQAATYIAELGKAGRYQRDVY